MFSSIEDVIERFAKNDYIASRRIATVIYLATALKKPILVEGPAGVGKTDLAKVLATRARPRAHPPAVLRRARRGQGALRMGVRQAAALHADPEGQNQRGADGRQGPEAEAVDRIAKEDEVFFSERFVLPRPLLKAIKLREANACC